MSKVEGVSTFPVFVPYYALGGIYFNKQQDCQKAIDLFGDNVRHLFND